MSPLQEEQVGRCLSGDPSPADAVERQDLCRRILELLETLPINQREVIRLKFQNGFSYKEISRITGHSISNVGYLIHAGIKTLRGHLFRRPGGRGARLKETRDMTFDPNDPRLTAYVLGELDESERPEIEAMLESSHEARHAVDEIRQTIGWLSDRLREEQAPHVNGPVAETVSLKPTAAAAPQWSRKVVLRLSAVAALLLIGGTVGLVSFSIAPGARAGPGRRPSSTMIWPPFPNRARRDRLRLWSLPNGPRPRPRRPRWPPKMSNGNGCSDLQRRGSPAGPWARRKSISISTPPTPTRSTSRDCPPPRPRAVPAGCRSRCPGLSVRKD